MPLFQNKDVINFESNIIIPIGFAKCNLQLKYYFMFSTLNAISH